jgi:hypothetical protein
MENNYFEELYNLNVNENVEKKNGLSYLSWAWAIAEVLKKQPSMTYEILRFENNLPYIFDEKTGYMVFTRVTISGITREMWLPVMDSANKTMLDHEYTYEVKNYKTGEITEKKVAAATMFDINKTIMRCLTKNLAMFGLGLYIYAGEDLPEEEATRKIEPEQIEKIMKLVPKQNFKAMLTYYKVDKIEDMLYDDARDLIERKESKAEENANGKNS